MERPRGLGPLLFLNDHNKMVAVKRISCRALIHIRREENIPELGSGREKFNGHKRTFLIELCRTSDIHLNLLLRSRILEGKFRSSLQTFPKNDRATGCADGVRGGVDGFFSALQVDQDGNAQMDALGAAALLCCGLALQSGTHSR